MKIALLVLGLAALASAGYHGNEDKRDEIGRRLVQFKLEQAMRDMFADLAAKSK